MWAVSQGFCRTARGSAVECFGVAYPHRSRSDGAVQTTHECAGAGLGQASSASLSLLRGLWRGVETRGLEEAEETREEELLSLRCSERARVFADTRPRYVDRTLAPDRSVQARVQHQQHQTQLVVSARSNLRSQRRLHLSARCFSFFMRLVACVLLNRCCMIVGHVVGISPEPHLMHVVAAPQKTQAARAGATGTMAATLARSLAGVALMLATAARGFVAPAAMMTLGPRTATSSSSASMTCSHQRQRRQQQQQQQRFAFAPTPAATAVSSFLGHARSLDRPSTSGSRRRLEAGVAGARAARQCGGVGGGASTTATTMGLGFLAPGGGRRLAFAALANAAAFATVGGAYPVR